MERHIRDIDRLVDDKLVAVDSGHAVNQSLKWLPLLALLVCSCRENKAEIIRQAKILGLSEVLALTVLESCSRFLPRKRPDPSMAADSFPSGHTAQAFLGAELLRQRMKGTSRLVGMGGYGVAIAMAALRLMNKKHWLTDVVAGAVLGAGCAKLATLLLDNHTYRQGQ